MVLKGVNRLYFNSQEEIGWILDNTDIDSLAWYMYSTNFTYENFKEGYIDLESPKMKIHSVNRDPITFDINRTFLTIKRVIDSNLHFILPEDVDLNINFTTEEYMENEKLKLDIKIKELKDKIQSSKKQLEELEVKRENIPEKYFVLE